MTPASKHKRHIFHWNYNRLCGSDSELAPGDTCFCYFFIEIHSRFCNSDSELHLADGVSRPRLVLRLADDGAQDAMDAGAAPELRARVPGPEVPRLRVCLGRHLHLLVSSHGEHDRPRVRLHLYVAAHAPG